MAATFGWILDRSERTRLLERFQPAWPDVIADHVTLGAMGEQIMPTATTGEVVGSINDGEGVQALIVAIDGTTRRPDGRTYHITWSIDRQRGRRPVESNPVISRLGWLAHTETITISLYPRRL